LVERFGFRIVYDSHSKLDAKLNSVLKNGVWCWRPAHSENLVEIQSKLLEVQLGLVDKPIWSIARSGTFGGRRMLLGFSTHMQFQSKLSFLQRCSVLDPPMVWNDLIVEKAAETGSLNPCLG
jgi:hypothetical protein